MLPPYLEIIQTLRSLTDFEDKYEYMIQLSSELEFESNKKIEKNLIKGCQSRTWVVCSKDKSTNRNSVLAISDSRLVSGLIVILLSYCNSLSESYDLNKVDLDEITNIELGNFLSPNRQLGLNIIWQRIKSCLQ